jgi:hypothetical protein
MSEDNEPDRWAELAKPSEFMIHEMERAQRMMRDYQPQIRQIEQAQRIFRENERLIRQAQQVAQAAERFARITNWPKTSIGSALPYPLWLASVMDAHMRKLLSPGPAAHQRSAALNVNVAMSASAEVAAAGGLALSPTVFVSDGDVATLSETASVEVIDSPRRGLAALSDGEIVFLVLVWLYALVLPWFGTALPPELHAMLTDGYATVAIALAITWRVLDKQK